MATYKGGLLSLVNGKIGPMVSYTTKTGYSVLREVGVRTAPFTLPELGNQSATALVTNLLRSVMPVIRVGFKNSPIGKHWTAYNHASSVIKRTAIKGTYPDREIDYEKLTFSVGDIPVPANVEVELNENQLNFTWKADLKNPGTHKNDRVMIVVYFPESLKAVYQFVGAKRTEEKETFDLPELIEETVLETYISYVGEFGESFSNSAYAGQIIAGI